MKPSKVVVVGSMNMDFIVEVEKIPSPGETLMSSALQLSPGGKGSNQAAAIALLGGDVSLIASLGSDETGRALLNHAQRIGIETTHVAIDEKAKSGSAFISVSNTGENTIVVAAGANKALSPQQVAHALSKIEDASVLISCLEVNVQTVKEALAMAQPMGIKTILNFSPYSNDYVDLIRLVDYLIVNEHELIHLTGFDVAQLPKAKKYLNQLGASNVIVTLGENGVIAFDAQDLGAQSIHVTAPKVRVLDTTGCGDSFTGAFALEISKGVPLAESLRSATKVASFAATGSGAQTSYGTRDEIEKYFHSILDFEPPTVSG